MTTGKSDLIDLTVEIAVETERAVLVHTGDKSKSVWLPKSQVEIERDNPVGGVAVLTLPEWLAMDKGLI